MKDLITMWKYPKMVTLVALSAALYAALLIPFKSFMLLPGIEVRIGTAIVPALGILFGPAGAWGAAIGNLIGDFFGSIGIGSIFGFLCNFFFAYVPYKFWYAGKGDNYPITNSPKKVVKYLGCSLASTCAQIAVLCFGLAAVISSLPYKVLPPILIFTNGLVPFVLGAPLISLFTPRLKKWGLLFTSIMKPEDCRRASKTNVLGMILTIVGTLVSIAMGLYFGYVLGIDTGLKLLAATGPIMIVFIIGICLIGIYPKEFVSETVAEDEDDDEPSA